MAHIVSLTNSYQESSIFVLTCHEVTETLNPIHFAKEPPDKNNVIIKITHHNNNPEYMVINPDYTFYQAY